VVLAAPVVGVLGGLVVLALPRRARRLAVGLVATGAAAFEVAGSRRPRGGPGAHLISFVASGLIAGGWTSGVWREALRGRGR
jgi:hypothetical protein